MSTLRNRFHTKIRQRVNNEDGIAMAAVLIVLMVMVMTTVLIVSTILSQVNQTKTFNMTQQAKGTADFGLNAFMTSVNTSTGHKMFEQHRTSSSPTSEQQKKVPANALCKTLAPTVSDNIGYATKYCVWTVKVASSTGTSGYYVYSKGFSIDTSASASTENKQDEVILRALVEPRVVSTTADNKNGKYVYKLTSDAPFQLGISGAEGVTVHNNAKLYSYSFGGGGTVGSGTSTAFTALASDKKFTMPSTPFKVGALVAPSTVKVADICTPNGPNCTDPIHSTSPVSASMDDVARSIDAECPLGAESYPDWRVSNNGPFTSSGCYNNVWFDKDMNVGMAFTPASPLKLNIKGSTLFAAGVKVSTTRDPAALQIRTKGGIHWSEAPTTTSVPGKTNAYIASSSSCTSLTLTKAPVHISGALSCGTLDIGPTTTIYMDTKSQQYGINMVDGVPTNSIWFQTYIEQL